MKIKIAYVCLRWLSRGGYINSTPAEISWALVKHLRRYGYNPSANQVNMCAHETRPCFPYLQSSMLVMRVSPVMSHVSARSR